MQKQRQIFTSRSSKLFQLQELVFQRGEKKHFTWEVTGATQTWGLKSQVTVVCIVHTSQSGLEILQKSQVL